jgi:hypothetical protein
MNGKSYQRYGQFWRAFDLIDEFAHEHQLSPRVNVVWQPTETTTFTAAIRATSCHLRTRRRADHQLVATTTAAPAITQDTTSKAERDHYFDIGASQIILPASRWGRRLLQAANDLLTKGSSGR